MKKNIVGVAIAQKAPKKSKWKRLDLIPRLLCLLLALIVWLLVVNLREDAPKQDLSALQSVTQTVS